MQFLHSRHVIHRDLKSFNVLLDIDGHPRICDFGFSKTIQMDDVTAMQTVGVGTPHWMAPEMLAHDTGYTLKVDVYAYGIVLWEIVTGQFPFGDMQPMQVIARVGIHDARPELPPDMNPGLRALICRCWDRNPDLRPTFDEVVECFLSGQVGLDGADMEQFMIYIHENMHHYAAEIDLLNITDNQDLKRLVGAPLRIITRAWPQVEALAGSFPAEVGQLAASILGGPMRTEAAALLRLLPCGSVGLEVISAAVEMIPTGCKELDRDIVVAACKNGAADYAAIYALAPTHVALALEVVSQNGADRMLRASVATKCVQCLAAGGAPLVCAALRCLVSIGETKKIPMSALRTFLQSDVPAVRACTLVAAMTMGLAGVEVSADIIERIMQPPLDQAREDCVAALCSQPHAALTAVNAMICRVEYEPKVVFRILAMAARHVEGRPAVAVAFQKFDLTQLMAEWGRTIHALRLLVAG
jgi:hypothetical protein